MAAGTLGCLTVLIIPHFIFDHKKRRGGTAEYSTLISLRQLYYSTKIEGLAFCSSTKGRPHCLHYISPAQNLQTKPAANTQIPCYNNPRWLNDNRLDARPNRCDPPPLSSCYCWAQGTRFPFGELTITLITPSGPSPFGVTSNNAIVMAAPFNTNNVKKCQRRGRA